MLYGRGFFFLIPDHCAVIIWNNMPRMRKNQSECEVTNVRGTHLERYALRASHTEYKFGLLIFFVSP